MYEQTLINQRRASVVGRGSGAPRHVRSWIPHGAQSASQDAAALHWRERGQPNRWRPAEPDEVRRS